MANEVSIVVTATKDVEKNTPVANRRIESMSDEEIIQENLKELLDKRSREERKANGRLIAVIVAFLVIFVAIYHAWIRRTGVLAGVLVPAAIMISYASWVVMLAKRDKQKKAIFDKHIEEVALRNKAELEEKAKLIKAKKAERRAEASLHYENELPNVRNTSPSATDAGGVRRPHHMEPRKHRKHHRQRQAGACSSDYASGSGSSGSGSGGSGGGGGGGGGGGNRKFSSHHATKYLRVKRPSIRQKLFRQHATVNLVAQVQSEVSRSVAAQSAATSSKRKRLERTDALSVLPPLVRMSSAP